MYLTEHTIQHSVKVAEIMSKICKRFGENLNPEDMYLLGLVHDIGKLLNENKKPILLESVGHAHRGGAILEQNGYQYSDEVFHHGHPEEDYRTPAWYLLNAVDLAVDKNGVLIGHNLRMLDIQNRYGKDSVQYKRARRILDEIYNLRHYDVEDIKEGVLRDEG